MGKGKNYIATNKEIADKIGAATPANPSHLCTNARALRMGGYSPSYKKGLDNYCVKYSQDFYTQSTNLSYNCEIHVNSSINDSGLKIVANASANVGYNMASLELQDSLGAVIKTVTSAPFVIDWTPDLNFRFVATATPIEYTNRIYYSTNNGQGIAPSDVTAFNVPYLQSVYDSAKNEGYLEFDGTLTIVGRQGISLITNVTSISLPSTITTLDLGAFGGDSSLSSISMPGVLHIGIETFLGTEFTSITFPDTLIDISTGAFQDCPYLFEIHLPASLTYMQLNPFSSCPLTIATVDSLNTVYESRGNCIVRKATNTIEVGTINGTIDNTVTRIGRAAFTNLPMTSITIPASVTYIEDYAFYSCYNLQSITVLNNTPPTLEVVSRNTQVFDGTYCPIYVPTGCLADYQRDWARYADRIQEIS